MDSNGFHIRDRIVLDRTLIGSLPIGTLRQQGVTTLHFIGREVVIHEEDGAKPRAIRGFDVVLIADTLDRTGGGSLVVEALDDAPGGVARPGPRVQVFCRELRGLHVRAVGGQGTKGPPQEKEGKAGFIECSEDPQHPGKQICRDTPEPDPTGPRGHPGKAGGAGGTISLAREGDGHASPKPGTLAVLGPTAGGGFGEVGPRLTVGHQPGAVAVRVGNPKTTLYVLNREEPPVPRLSVVDATAPLKEVGRLRIGSAPVDVVVNGTNVYVSDWQGGPGTRDRRGYPHGGARRRTARRAGVKHGLHGLALDPGRGRLFAARTYRSSPAAKINALTVIDPGEGQVVGSVEVGPDPTQPVDVAVDPTTGRVYTANLGGASVPPGVTVLEPVPGGQSTYRVVDTVRTQAGVRAVAADPGRRLVYAAAGNGVQVSDAGHGEHRVVATVPTGKLAHTLGLDPGTGHVYVGDAIEGTLTRLAPLDPGAHVQWA